MQKKTQYYWIIGLLCPIIGLILYFVWSNKSKNKASNVLVGTIIGFCLGGLAFLYFAQQGSKYENRSIDEWMNDINSGKEVVTIFGASYCSHCKEYKPVIFKIAKKNKINLYFYEIDITSTEDKDRLVNTYELTDFDGSVPYTFIMKDKKFVASDVGFQDEESTLEFLKENGILKN